MFEVKRIENDIIQINIAGPEKTMHVIDENFINKFEEIINELKSDSNYKGIFITSAHDEFIAGGDLSMLLSVEDLEQCRKMTNRLSKTFRHLETLGKPVVACLNGTTLGGGYELALACHHRISLNNPKIKIGLPEVTLGLLPGAGGTQRLPRMIGFQQALPYLLQGKTVSPEKALKDGLIDQIVKNKEELIFKAIEFIQSNPESIKPWDQKKFNLPGGEIQSKSGYMIIPGATAMMSAKTYGNYLAPKNILCCLYEGLQVPLDQGLEIEATYFSELVLNSSTKKMIRTLFYSMQECNRGIHRPKDIPKSDIKKVGILGAGMMGAGIAYVAAKAGIEVVLKDISIEIAEKGKNYSATLLDKAIERGRSSTDKKELLLSLIKATENYEDLKECDLIIEAVIEDRNIKSDVTKATEKIISPNAIFSSNTSTLPITGLAEESSRPESFIGLHFFSPVDKMPLVEVILGEKTNDKALAVCLDFISLIKKTPIVVNDGRGFFTSRVFTTYISEGIKLLTEGVSPAVIENAGKQAGMPVGPLAVADEVSIDLIYHILNQTKKDLGEEAIDQETFNTAQLFVEKLGRLGRKSGKGFYEYPKEGSKYLSPELKTIFKQSEKEIPFEDIKKRLLYIQSLETLKCLEENILTSARDGDVGSIIGFGFPAYTGGALSYVEFEGTDLFKQTCLNFKKVYGSRFSPPQILEKITEEKLYK